MSLRFLLPVTSRVTDANGCPVAGALLYFYESGTTTPALVYADEALTVPHSFPVVSDSSGAPPPIFFAKREYRLEARTPLGAMLPGYPVDPLYGDYIENADRYYAANFPDLATAGLSLPPSDVSAVWVDGQLYRRTDGDPAPENGFVDAAGDWWRISRDDHFPTLFSALADVAAGGVKTGGVVHPDGDAASGDGGDFLGVVEADASPDNPEGGRIRPLGALNPISFGATGDGSTADTAVLDTLNVEGNTLDLRGRTFAYTGDFVPVALITNGTILSSVRGPMDFRARATVDNRPTRETELMMADTQPTPDKVSFFETRISLLARKLNPDLVTIAGDIADEGSDAEFGADAYLFEDLVPQMMGRLDLPPSKFLVIPGNHDITFPEDGNDVVREPGSYQNSEYRKWFEREFWVHKQGNHVRIGMGCMARNTGGNITDTVLEWLNHTLQTTQAYNRTLYIHQPLHGTFSTTVTGTQLDSQRIVDVLERPGNKVTTCYSGHTGSPTVATEADTFSDPTYCQGCVFINAHGHWGADDQDGARPSSAMEIVYRDGSADVVVNRYNISDIDLPLIPGKSHVLAYPYPMRLAHEAHQDSRFDNGDRPILFSPTRSTGYIYKYKVDGEWLYTDAPQASFIASVVDLDNSDTIRGMGAGYAMTVPGANSGSHNANQVNQNQPDAIAVLIGAERLTNEELVYDAGLSVWAYAADGGSHPEHNLDRIMRIEPDKMQLDKVAYTIRGASADAGAGIIGFTQLTGGFSAMFYARGPNGDVGWSGSEAILKLGHTSNQRSINAGGTINSAGADFAEYREVADPDRKVRKGEIVGMDASGKLTTVYDDVVGRFYFKSTAPNLVGNDIWSQPEYLAKKYDFIVPGEEPEKPEIPSFKQWSGMEEVPDRPSENSADLEVTEDVSRKEKREEYRAIKSEIKGDYKERCREWRERTKALKVAEKTERHLWDRIALCGVVPVRKRFDEADVGRYIIPVRADDGGIEIIVATEDDLTVPQYIRACGIVETVVDRRATVLVKPH